MCGGCADHTQRCCSVAFVWVWCRCVGGALLGVCALDCFLSRSSFSPGSCGGTPAGCRVEYQSGARTDFGGRSMVQSPLVRGWGVGFRCAPHLCMFPPFWCCPALLACVRGEPPVPVVTVPRWCPWWGSPVSGACSRHLRGDCILRIWSGVGFRGGGRGWCRLGWRAVVRGCVGWLVPGRVLCARCVAAVFLCVPHRVTNSSSPCPAFGIAGGGVFCSPGSTPCRSRGRWAWGSRPQDLYPLPFGVALGCCEGKGSVRALVPGPTSHRRVRWALTPPSLWMGGPAAGPFSLTK